MTKTKKVTPWPSDAGLRKATKHLQPGQILALWPPEKRMLKGPVRMWRLHHKQSREIFTQADRGVPVAR